MAEETKLSSAPPEETQVAHHPPSADQTRMDAPLVQMPGVIPETGPAENTEVSPSPPGAESKKMIQRRSTSRMKAVRRVQKTGKYQKPGAGGTTKKRMDKTEQPVAEVSEQTTVGSQEALEDRILKKLDAHDAKAQVRRDPLIGRTIANRFTIVSKIGAGGMGAVYKAKQKGMDRNVAIKVLLQEYASNETVVKRFHLEALAVSKLNHPNTISIFDFGQTDDGVLYIAMEMLVGQALEEAIRVDKQLSVKRALHIMRQVCLSLTEAHAMGIVHRDLKPDNIFLVKVGSDENFAKVLDFGVAKLKQVDDNQGTLTQAGVIFGTPKYMSPEQSRSLDLDPRSDIYSLGVILYEMLAGVPPFDAENPLAILIQHVQTPPPPFQQIRPDLLIPQEVEAVVRKAMAKKANDRQQTTEEFIKEIEDVEYLLKNRPEFDIVLTRENIDKIDIRPDHRASLTHPSGIVSLLPIADGVTGPAYPEMQMPSGTDPQFNALTGGFSQDHVDTQMVLGQGAQTIQGLVVPQVAKSGGVGKWLILTFALLVVIAAGAAGFFFFKTERLPKYQNEIYSFENFSKPLSGEIRVAKATITTVPKGAAVWINGKNTGQFTLDPFVIERLPGSGTLNVELRFPEYKPVKRMIAFNEHGSKSFSITMEPLKKPEPIVVKPVTKKPVVTKPVVKKPIVVVKKKIKKKRPRKVPTLKNSYKKKRVVDIKSPY